MPIQFHAPLQGKAARSPVTLVRTDRTLSAFGLAAILAAAVMITLSLSVFLYRGYLLRKIAAMDEMLTGARKSFQPEFVEEASRLNARLQSAKEILSRHMSLSPLFDFLEKKTLENVRFTRFIFDASGGALKLQMVGQAKSFNAVALQSDIFGAERYLKDPVFSDFSLGEDGTVIFNFKAAIEPVFLDYRETIITRLPAGAGDSFDDEGEATSSLDTF